jgi:hypothetical protein
MKRLLRSRPGNPKRTETTDPDTGRVEWEAYEVTVEENLASVLDSPLKSSVTLLVAELAALVHLTAAVRAAQTDKEGGPSASTRLPSPTPAWADHRLNQAASRLTEEALAVAVWNNHPFDPDKKTGCVECGWVSEKGDLYCRQCGTPTLRAYRRCGLCGSLRKDCGHTSKDLTSVQPSGLVTDV